MGDGALGAWGMAMEWGCGIGGRVLKVDLVSYLALEEWLNCEKIDGVETNLVLFRLEGVKIIEWVGRNPKVASFLLNLSTQSRLEESLFLQV